MTDDVKDNEVLSIEYLDPDAPGTAIAEPPPAEEALRTELDQVKDKYLRTLAEMENLRKRLQKEREEFVQYGLQNFLKEFLPILDNLRRGLAEAPPDDRMAEGVAMILRQTEGLLERVGVSPVPGTEGDPFDPFIHEALSTEPSPEAARPMIRKVLQQGYFLHQRLLRPSLVHALVPAAGNDDDAHPGH
jgi:molecular chaperone GrpE